MLNTKFVTIIIAFLFFGGAKAGKHPLHVSTTEVNFNARDKTLEVSCKIFSDDFEAVLAKSYKQKTDLSNAAMKAAMDELVKRYLTTHLEIVANGQPTKMKYLGFEIDHEATNIYLEVEKIPSLKSLKVTNTILYDMFDDQMSIVHLVKGNVRKSSKILYPDKQFATNF